MFEYRTLTKQGKSDKTITSSLGPISFCMGGFRPTPLILSGLWSHHLLTYLLTYIKQLCYS